MVAPGFQQAGTPTVHFMKSLLLKYRIAMISFIFGLIVSGVTAFPLLWELKILTKILGVSEAVSPEGYTGLQHLVLVVRWGLEEMYGKYPWIAYGTDWLAFAHLALAVFFIGPLVDPVRNVWVVYAGLSACLAVIPLALICGPLRGLPFYWQLIDCSFGVFGALPLLYCLSLTKRMNQV